MCEECGSSLPRSETSGRSGRNSPPSKHVDCAFLVVTKHSLHIPKRILKLVLSATDDDLVSCTIEVSINSHPTNRDRNAYTGRHVQFLIKSLRTVARNPNSFILITIFINL